MPAPNDRSPSPQAVDASSSEPLGLKHPLGQNLLTPQFIAPVGARSLMPDLPASPDYPPTVSFADSPFFADSRSALTIQAKRSTATLVAPPPSDQLINDRPSNDRPIPQLPTLQKFPESTVPFMPSPLSEDEAATVPAAPADPSNNISDGTLEVTDSKGLNSPLIEIESDRPTSDQQPVEPPQTDNAPPSIQRSSLENSPSPQMISPTDSSAQDGGNSVLSPLPPQPSEATVPTKEVTSEIPSSPIIATDTVPSLPSNEETPAGAKPGLTAPPNIPTIQPRFEETSTEPAPTISPEESSQLASPHITPSSEIAQPEMVRETPLQPQTPTEASPPKIQTQLESPQSNPQVDHQAVTNETVSLAATPVQNLPKQNTSPIQTQADAPSELDESATATPIPVAPETVQQEQSSAPPSEVQHSPIERSDVTLPPSVLSPISPAFADSPAPTDSNSPTPGLTDPSPTDSTTSTVQTRLETDSSDLPPIPVLPVEGVESAKSELLPQHPLAQVSDVLADSMPPSPHDGITLDAPVAPVQRSPVDQPPNLQAPGLQSPDLQPNQVQLTESAEEVTQSNIPSSPIDPTIAPGDVTLPSAPPSAIPQALEQTPTAELVIEPTAQQPIDSTRSEVPPAPPLTSPLPDNNSATSPKLQLKQGDVENSNNAPPHPVADVAVPFTQVEPVSEPTSTIVNSPDTSSPVTPVEANSREITPSPVQPESSLSPISPTEVTPTVDHPSPAQPTIQRQPTPNVAIPPSILREQPQVDDRHSVPTNTIPTKPPVVEDNTATEVNTLSAIPDSIALSSLPIVEASTAEVTTTESTSVQASPEPSTFPKLPTVLQSLTTLNPLGNSKPLVQPSLLTSPPPQPEAPPANLQLQAAQTVAEASPNNALNGSPTQVIQRQTESRIQVPSIAPRINEGLPPSPTVKSTPDSWTSIDELLGRSPTPIIQRFVDEPLVDPIFNQPNLNRFDNYQGYQPLSDLPPIGSPSIDLPAIASPNNDTNPSSMPGDAPAGPEAIETASNEQSGAQPNQPSKQQDEAEKLEELAREIYQLLRQRFEIERERHGNYYPDRLF